MTELLMSAMHSTYGNGVFTVVLSNPNNCQELSKSTHSLINKQRKFGQCGCASGNGPSLVKHNALYLQYINGMSIAKYGILDSFNKALC